MKRLVVLSLVFAGCADNRETLFVRQVQAFDEECTVQPDVSGLFHTGGTLDVSFQGEYVLTPLIDNQMVARENHDAVRVESNGVQIDGAIIRIYETDDPSLPPEETEPVREFFSYASSYIEPGGVGASIFVAIPHEYTTGRYADICGFEPGGNFNGSTQVSDLVLVGATVQGITNGGLAVESPEFYYPVTLCCGCLIACTPEADDPANEATDLPPSCDSTDEVTQLPCVYGQDDPVDCRLTRQAGDPFLSFVSRCGS